MGSDVATDRVVAFVRQRLGEPSNPKLLMTDLGEAYGLDGDEFDAFMVAFGKEFDVDMSGSIWYFHHAEDPHLGFMFHWIFLPPNRRVVRIPISLALLERSASSGRWEMTYPPHKLPRWRYDILLAQGLVLGLVILAVLGLSRL